MTSELVLRDVRGERVQTRSSEAPLGSLEESSLARKQEGPAGCKRVLCPGRCGRMRAGGAGTGDVEKGLACRTKESERYSTSNGKLGKAFKEGAIELGLTF